MCHVLVSFCYWQNRLCKQVIVFSSEGSSLPHHRDIPLVALPGIDDSYPPQRKSFAMLRYMYDHYRDHFRFFMRADDDIYIHADVLRSFLHSINSTGRPLFIGQVLAMMSLQHCSNTNKSIACRVCFTLLNNSTVFCKFSVTITQQQLPFYCHYTGQPALAGTSS